MSTAVTAIRRRRNAVNRRPPGLRRKYARKTAISLIGAGFGGKVSKTARKSKG